jgi:hypothetical protein
VPAVSWTLACSATTSAAGVDVKGRYVQGPPGQRFIYLSWGTVDDRQTLTLFRRAKLQLGSVPVAVMAQAVEKGVLVGRLGLADARGNPLCAAVRPPTIEWTSSAL